MPRRDQAADNSHARFMRAVNEELSKFEYSEREFRRKDRDERAKRLQMPAQKFDNADRRKTFKILVVEPEDIPQGNALPLGQDGRGFESGERYLRSPTISCRVLGVCRAGPPAIVKLQQRNVRGTFLSALGRGWTMGKSAGLSLSIWPV